MKIKNAALGLFLSGFTLSCSPQKDQLRGNYELGEEKVEFRFLASDSFSGNEDDWIELPIFGGGTQYVSKKMAIESDAVMGVSVDLFLPDRDLRVVTIHKKEYWDHIYGVTKELNGKRIGIIRHGKLVATWVEGPLDSQGEIKNLTPQQIQFFVRGMKKTGRPFRDEILKDHVEWLKKMLKQQPDDLLRKRLLAGHLLNTDMRNCKEAESLFEEISKEDKSTIPYARLAACYSQSNNWNKSVEVSLKALQQQSDPVYPLWMIRGDLGLSYLYLKQPELALAQLELAIKELEKQTPDILLSQEMKDTRLKNFSNWINKIKGGRSN